MRGMFLIGCLICSASGARADRVDRGLAKHSLGLGFDLHGADLGPSGAGGFGVALLVAAGGGRFQLIGDAAIGDLNADGGGGRDLGFYARSSLGVRMLAATLSSGRDSGTALGVDAGVGSAHYFLDGINVHRPTIYAGWTLMMGGASDKHGLNITYQLRLDASPRLDDAMALRAICRGTCPNTDESIVDLTLSGVLGVSAW